MRLAVDFPKSDGSGTSNDSNTSRRAFAEYERTAEIHGIDQNLIFRCTCICTIFCFLSLLEH